MAMPAVQTAQLEEMIPDNNEVIVEIAGISTLVTKWTATV